MSSVNQILCIRFENKITCNRWDSVECHPNRRHNNERNGNETDHPSSKRGLRLLHQVPQEAHVPAAPGLGKDVRLFFLDVEQFFLHLLHDGFFANIKLALATGLQVDFIDAPIFQIFAKGQDAHFIHHMEFASSIESQNAFEGTWVDIKEVLVVHQGIRVAVFQDLFVSYGQGQFA